MKGDRKRGKRTIKYTRTKPPLTYSYGDKIPRAIEHRINGNVRLTYVPILATDLETNKDYVLTESEEEIEVGDPGGPKATSLTPKKRITREDKLKKEFLEQHANGELNEKGIPAGKSLVIYPDPRERSEEVGVMAEISGWNLKNDPLGLLNEQTEIFNVDTATETDLKDEINNDLLNLHPDEWDKSFDNKPDTKPQMICTIRRPESMGARNWRPVNKASGSGVGRKEEKDSDSDVFPDDYVNPDLRNDDYYTETPRVLTKTKNMFRSCKNRYMSTPINFGTENVTFGEIEQDHRKVEEREDQVKEDYDPTSQQIGQDEEDQIYASETGSSFEETTFEKENKAAFIHEIEQTVVEDELEYMEVTQPDGVTRTIRRESEEIKVVRVTPVMIDLDVSSEEEIFGDGSERFGGFEIRRPSKEPHKKQERRKLQMHKQRGCKLEMSGGRNEKIQEDYSKSVYYTPRESPINPKQTCNPNKHPMVTERLRTHFINTGCDIIGQNAAQGTTTTTSSGNIRLEYTSGLGKSAEEVNGEGVGSNGDENEEYDDDPNDFGALTVADNILIASSLTDMERLPIEMKGRYRQLVGRLMRNTGVMFGEESMKKGGLSGISEKQSYFLRKKCIPDFRRQTETEGIDDGSPAKPSCNQGGCSNKF